jgi:cysteine desulfurase
VTVNGSLSHRLPNNIHLSFLSQDNERLLFGLDQAGILAAAGSACSASNEEPSHVLKAIGLSDNEARSSLRFTMGRATVEHDIQQAIRTLSHLLHS